MVDVSAAVEVDAPVGDVWRAAVDWERQGDWIPATRVRVTRGDGTGVGDQIVARTAVGAIGFDDPMEIVRWQPFEMCEVRHLGRVVRGTGLFTVTPVDGDRSRFTWTERMDVPFGQVGAVAFALTRPLATVALRFALRRFARSLGPRADASKPSE